MYVPEATFLTAVYDSVIMYKLSAMIAIFTYNCCHIGFSCLLQSSFWLCVYAHVFHRDQPCTYNCSCIGLSSLFSESSLWWCIYIQAFRHDLVRVFLLPHVSFKPLSQKQFMVAHLCTSFPPWLVHLLLTVAFRVWFMCLDNHQFFSN